MCYHIDTTPLLVDMDGCDPKYLKEKTETLHKFYSRDEIFVRMGLAGVRMGLSDRVEIYLMPRPGEETVGSDAYRRSVEGGTL